MKAIKDHQGHLCQKIDGSIVSRDENLRPRFEVELKLGLFSELFFMSKNPLFDLYEKLYFHEIEVREKLGGRLQTPMAIIVSLIGVLTYLLQNFDKDHTGTASPTFLLFFALSGMTLVTAVYFFVRSWYGNTYAFLPSAEATEEYRQLLQKTYEQYKNGDSLAETYLNDYLCTKYIACAVIVNLVVA